MKKDQRPENFKKELPEEYGQVLYIDARRPKFGIIFNLIALAVLALVVICAVIPMKSSIVDVYREGMSLPVYLVFIISLLLYIVLHELVHGAAYKSLTGQKLTYGFSWSCAFCGVPQIFVYRRTALIALAAPLVTFTLILLPLCVWLYFVSPIYYILFAVVFGLHLGGCSGDIYMMILLLFKYKSAHLLMRDTGPEQYLYLPKENG